MKQLEKYYCEYSQINGFSDLTIRIRRLKKMKKYLINNRSTVVTISLLIFIIGLGSFLRFYHIGKLSFWLDEAYMFNNSKNGLITAIKNETNMSLYYVLIYFWIRIFPTASDGTLRALSAVISVVSIPVVFLLGRTMTTNRKMATTIGLIAAFLISVNAFNIQYAQEFRSYSLTFLLTTLSSFLLINAVEDIESTHHWLIWYTIVTAASVYSHFYAVFIIAAQAVTLPILLLDKNKHFLKFKQILYCCFGMTSLILPIAIVAYIKGPGQISWIPEPTLGTLKSFSSEITGGKWLFVLYLLFGCIGLLFGEGVGFQNDLITKWKFTLMASCLFLPVIMALVISKIMIPIFLDKYLLYVMPYLAVLVATGIVALVSYGWKRKKFKFLFVSIGIIVLVLFALLSTASIQSYYNNYQKEDWRKATQFLTLRCSESLRLYYAPFVDIDVLYYNPALYSQEAEWWKNILSKNPDSNELTASLPNGYSQVCLVLSHVGNQQQEKIIQAAIQKKFPIVSTFMFYGLEIEIDER